MQKDYRYILVISMFILISISPITANAEYIESKKNQSFVNDQHILEDGRVEEFDGITILHVGGTYYEMGYQHGYLLKEKIQKIIPVFIDYFKNKNGVTYAEALNKKTKTE
jgi:hypothetical protein